MQIKTVYLFCFYRITSSSGEDLGRAQVFRADAPQVEETTDVSPDGRVTKRVRVTVTCDISFHGEDDQTIIVTGGFQYGGKAHLRTSHQARLPDGIVR